MGVQINGSEGNVIATKGTYSGNVTIGGTLTYEDVTNIDSVGLITARSGIEIGARPGVGASISVDGNAIFSGITTAATLKATTGIVTTLTVAGDVDISDKIIHTGDTNTAIRFPAADTITAETSGSERIRIDSSGRIGVGVVPTAQFAHNLIQIGHQATLGANAALSATGQTFLTHNLYFDTGGTIQVFNTSNANEGAIFRLVDGQLLFSNSAATTGTPTVTERLRITSDGKVGINQATPTAMLEVVDSIYHQAYMKGSSTVAGIRFGNTAHTNGYIYYDNGPNMNFQVGGVERLRIKSTGAVQLTSENTTGWSIDAGDNSASYTAIDNHFPTTNRTLYINNETTHRSIVFWNKNGSDGYGFGLDNSGNFKVVSGSSERMKISSQGYLTTPSTISFQAYNGGNTASGNYVVLTNTNWNDGNGYNTSNGVFTAPVTGTYLFTITALYTLNTATPSHKIVWHVNNVNAGVLAEWQDGSISNSYNTIGNSSVIFKLSATDTVRIYVEASTAHISGAQTRYCGHLIG